MMKNEIVKVLQSMSGKYSYHTIFRDWVATMALSIQNSCYIMHNSLWNKRERLYKDIMNRYDASEQSKFCDMLGMLAITFESNISDVLGEICMSQCIGSSRLGQFFTPFHLSELCTSLVFELDENEFEINEPSTGSGGMVIAAVKLLKEKGIDYQHRMHIVAQDLDWNGVYMTYVQLSLLGVKATVVQGNTLQEPYSSRTPADKIFYTPSRLGVLI